MDNALPIVLIGPMAAGKTTLARLLAVRLGLPLVPLDAIRWYYHLKDGFSFTHVPEEPGFAAVVRHWEPYSIAAVERVLAEFPGSVIDFGAGHAHYEDPDRVRRLEDALRPVRNVVLVLPTLDLDAAFELCRARDEARLGPARDPSRAEVNRRFLDSACFRRVARHTVVVEGRTPEAVVDEIVERLA